MFAISQEEKAKFDRDGVLIFDPELDSAVFDLIISDLGSKYGSDGEPLDVAYRDANRIQDAWRINPEVKNIARAPKTLALLEQLYGRKPLPFQTLNFPKGTEQPVHADALHFNSMPATFMCGVWVALEDIDMDNGPLVYYPGSHKLNEVTVAELTRVTLVDRLKQKVLRRSLGKTEPYLAYERYVADLIERENLQPQFATLRKGEALIWASNLLHGGAPQRDKSRSRHSQVTHYFFEGCRYYTPILSHGKKIVWRDPQWVV